MAEMASRSWSASVRTRMACLHFVLDWLPASSLPPNQPSYLSCLLEVLLTYHARETETTAWGSVASALQSDLTTVETCLPSGTWNTRLGPTLYGHPAARGHMKVETNHWTTCKAILQETVSDDRVQPAKHMRRINPGLWTVHVYCAAPYQETFRRLSNA